MICEEAKVVQSQKKAIPSSTRHNAFNSPLTRIKVGGIRAETHTHTQSAGYVFLYSSVGVGAPAGGGRRSLDFDLLAVVGGV